MKRPILILFFCGLTFGFLHAGNDIKQLSSVQQPIYQPPKVSEGTLANGIRYYLLEDHTLPMIQGRLFVRGGSVYEDKKIAGAGSVTASLLREGGTLNHKSSSLREILDENAIDVSFSTSLETIEGYFGSLSKDADLALELFFEILFKPVFEKEQLAIIKDRIIDNLKRDLELSGPISHREFRKMVYGSKNQWGKSADLKTIRKISRDDIVSFYRQFFSPDRMILAISGNFNSAGIIKKLEKLTVEYKKIDLPAVSPPPVANISKEETKLISRKFTQTAISVGHLGSTRDNPDKFAISVLNYVLGGSGAFTSRLHNALRVKGGLVYEIWSMYTFGPPSAPGIFQIHAKTRNQTVNKAVDLIKSELKKLSAEGITEEELRKAKAGILNSIVFEYENSFNVVSAVARFAYFGYPKNYIEVYRKGISAVSLADVNRAAKQYIFPDKLKTVIVGKKG